MRECDANGVGLSTEYDERGMIDRRPKPERVRDTGEKKKKRESFGYLAKLRIRGGREAR